MNIIKNFLFQTDFYEQISNKLSFIFQIVKLKKTLKTLSSGQKKPKKPKKTQKTQKNPKKPTGLGFFKKNRVFSNPAYRL
jgi:hypothetical protein